MATRRQIIYRRRRAALLAVMVAVIVTVAIILISAIHIEDDDDITPISTQTSVLATSVQTTAPETPVIPYPTVPEDVKTFAVSDDIVSQYGVLLDIDDNKVIASRKCNEKIYPASLTKVMTLLVAVENIKNFNDTFTMTYEIIKPLVDSDATRAGFKEGEVCQLSDLLYGAILPSGADATNALAQYVSGSEEEFVKLMNAKAKELGLKNTHFTNTSGLHNPDHYTTPLDMAIIMKTAMENDVCKKILSTFKYTTHPTEQNPEGLNLESTMFSRIYGTEVENVKILAGKTGYTSEAQHCLVSYAIKDEKPYIAVVAYAQGKYKPIFDTFTVYEKYLPPLESEITTAVAESTAPAQ